MRGRTQSKRAANTWHKRPAAGLSERDLLVGDRDAAREREPLVSLGAVTLPEQSDPPLAPFTNIEYVTSVDAPSNKRPHRRSTRVIDTEAGGHV